MRQFSSTSSPSIADRSPFVAKLVKLVNHEVLDSILQLYCAKITLRHRVRVRAVNAS